MQNLTPLDPYEIWQIYCGVRGEFSKYQEEYKVLGNAKWRTYATIERYSQFKDKSYEENALEVSRVLVGLYDTPDSLPNRLSQRPMET